MSVRDECDAGQGRAVLQEEGAAPEEARALGCCTCTWTLPCNLALGQWPRAAWCAELHAGPGPVPAGEGEMSWAVAMAAG